MDNTKQKRGTKPWIICLTLVLAAIILIQGWMIYGMRKTLYGDLHSFVPWITSHASRYQQRSVLPIDDIHRLQQEMNTLFENAFNESSPRNILHRFDNDWDTVGVSSSMSIEDKGRYYMVTVIIPETDKSNIDIRFEGRILSISAEQQHMRQIQRGTTMNGSSFRSEHFETKVMLPGPVDAGAAQASYENNALTIRIPKHTNQEPLAGHIQIR